MAELEKKYIPQNYCQIFLYTTYSVTLNPETGDTFLTIIIYLDSITLTILIQ